MEKAMRLDRFLVELKQGSRSEVKKIIKSGRVAVDGEICREPERKIAPSDSRVTLDARELSYESFEYFMLNKPAGVVSATEDRRFRTVTDLIADAKRRDLFPAGRLDIDTEGLLLITNDGRLAHQLLSPKKHVDKTYYAKVEGKLPEDAAEQFQKGLVLDDGLKTLPARLVLLGTSGEKRKKEADGVTEIELTIHEGKFHQVKRMFEAVGCRVVYLKRLSMGSLKLDNSLRPGEYRRLTKEELALLKGTPENLESPQKSRESDSMRQLLEEKKAFLFDLDGTLVDSMWMWGTIDIEYLGRFGLSCPEDLQKSIEGMSFTETAVYFKKRFNLPDCVEQIKKDWIAMSIEKYRTQVPLKRGVEKFLEKADKKGVKMAVCTSNGKEMAETVLESLGIRRHFQWVITGCEVAAGKPSPDIYLEAAKRLSVKPEDCAVFEDVPAGILAGKRAGMTVFAVKDDFSREMEEEKRKLADGFIESYEGLL